MHKGLKKLGAQNQKKFHLRMIAPYKSEKLFEIFRDFFLGLNDYRAI